MGKADLRSALIQGWYGRWDSKGVDSKIFFREKTLLNMLSESNFDSSAVINTWIDRGWIERGKNEKKVNIRINGSQSKCYCIDPSAINNDFVELVETSEETDFSSTTDNKIKEKCSNIDWDEWNLGFDSTNSKHCYDGSSINDIHTSLN